MHVISHGGNIVSSAVFIISPILWIGPAAGVSAWERGKEKEILYANIPDLCQLVMKKFIERANKEIPNWPEMVTKEKPVNRDYVKDFFKNQSGGLMVFQLGYAPTRAKEARYQLNTSDGLVGFVRAIIKDSEDNTCWGKSFKYISKTFGRNRSLEEFRADNFKLLREEIEFAAETIASDFIEDLKKGIKTVSE